MKAEVGKAVRIPGEFGHDYQADITVTTPSGKVYKFIARNLFDVGLVINPLEGGLPFKTEKGWMWDRWDRMDPMTDEELEAYRVASKAAAEEPRLARFRL